jgi:hypothetical protein
VPVPAAPDFVAGVCLALLAAALAVLGGVVAVARGGERRAVPTSGTPASGVPV